MTGPRALHASRLHLLYDEHGQSPWLDDLTRGYLAGGELSRWVAAGIRGVTSNPTIFARAIAGSTEYDEQFGLLTAAGRTVDQAYWQMVVDDITAALAVLRPVYETSAGADGFVSVEVAPDLAHDTAGTVAAARQLHERVGAPNLYVKVPATAEGIPAIRQLVAQGYRVNVTLVFGLPRYAQVIEAYLAGLEELAARDPHADLSLVPSVASFFVSRVDVAVDRRLAEIGGPQTAGLQGQAATAQAKLAYQLFRGGVPRAALGRAGGARRPGATAAVGLDVGEGPGPARHPLRRRPDRPGHRHHDAAGDDRRGRRPRNARAHGRPGPARGAGRPAAPREAGDRPRRGQRRPGGRGRQLVHLRVQRAARRAGGQGVGPGGPLMKIRVNPACSTCAVTLDALQPAGAGKSRLAPVAHGTARRPGRTTSSRPNTPRAQERQA